MTEAERAALTKAADAAEAAERAGLPRVEVFAAAIRAYNQAKGRTPAGAEMTPCRNCRGVGLVSRLGRSLETCSLCGGAGAIPAEVPTCT